MRVRRLMEIDVEGVGDRQDPGAQWNELAAQSVGVPAAVPPFMMVGDPECWSP